MKKTIYTLILTILLFFLNSAQSKENYTYYHLLNKSTPALPISISIIQELSDNNIKVDFQQGLSCSGKTQVDADKKISFVEFLTARYWTSLQNGDKQCDIDLSNLKFLAMSSQYFNIVVSKDSQIKVFDDIVKVKSIAFASSSANGLIVDAINKKYNTNIKKVLMVGSPEVAKAVLSGDVEVGIVMDIVSEKLNDRFTILSFGNPQYKNSHFNNLDNLPKHLGIVSLAYVWSVKNADQELYNRLIPIFQNAKRKIDKELPNNTFLVVKNIEDNTINEMIDSHIFKLHSLTKDIKQ
jgi:hypothetical protein